MHYTNGDEVRPAFRRRSWPAEWSIEYSGAGQLFDFEGQERSTFEEKFV